jgi:tRNA dimethylallyltransferase
MNRLVAVVGPTGVGKSRLALYLARALDGEIVSADSRQVYRYMDIGTAKPTPPELSLVPHHLIDAASPDEDFSLAQYQQLACKAIADINQRHKLALLVGGSGLYVWSVLEGWQIPAVAPDPEFRRRLEAKAAGGGEEELYQELARLDPVAAQRIDLRVDDMVKRGLVDEVKQLLERGYDASLPAMSGIGYKQISLFLEGKLTLAAAIQQIKFETHRLVRHQYSWFRLKDDRIRWFDIKTEKEAKILAWLKQNYRE